MAWGYLLAAVIFEILFAIGLKRSAGFTDLAGTALTIFAVPAGLYFLSLSLRDLPLSVAYPIWTGLGSIGVVLASRVIFAESLTIYQLVAIAVIIGAVAVLRSFSS